MKKLLVTKFLMLSILFSSNTFADHVVVRAKVKNLASQSGTSEDHKFWIDFKNADHSYCTGARSYRVYIVPHKGNVEAVKRAFAAASLALVADKEISIWTYASGKDCTKGHSVTLHN